MPRWVRIAIGALLMSAVIGAFYAPRLWRRVQRLARIERTEEQSRREVTQPPIATPTDVKVRAKLYWASSVASATLDADELELPLSADPVQRCKQLINALIADAPSAQQRTLSSDVTLLELYLLPDGTAIADFSDTLSSATPSGILSEQMAVDSIARTLAANVTAVHRLKILIHGQDAETLAGHLDLAGFFPVQSETPPAAPLAPPVKAAPPKGKGPAAELTRPRSPGKLSH